MAALTKGRQNPRLSGGGDDSAFQKGNTIVFAGGIVMLDVNGRANPGAAAVGSYAAGVAQTFRDLDRYDATATGPLGLLADDVQVVRWDEGVFAFANGGGGDAILSTTQPGVPVYIMDDQTVGLTNGSGLRSPAGRLVRLDSAGAFPVWVEMGKKIGRQLLDQATLTAGVGAVLAVASNTIAPTNAIHHVGAGLIKTITPPQGPLANGSVLNLIPDAAFTYDATGNLVVPSGGGTAVVNKLMVLVWDGTKWTPSY